MKMFSVLKSTASSLLTYHFFIAGIATLMALETNIILQQPFQHWSLYAFIFTSTHFAYNVYYIKTTKGRTFALFSVLSLLATAGLFFLIPVHLYPRLVFVAFASCIYIFPVFFPMKKDNSFTVQKLFLLVFIWVATTWVLPAQSGHYEVNTLILLIYRIAFIGISCLLFFIRDENNSIIRHKAGNANYILVALQFILSFYTLIFIQTILGLIFFFSSICCLLLLLHLKVKPRSHLFYLACADGVLGAQAIIILLLFLVRAL